MKTEVSEPLLDEDEATLLLTKMKRKTVSHTEKRAPLSFHQPGTRSMRVALQAPSRLGPLRGQQAKADAEHVRLAPAGDFTTLEG